MLNKVLFLWQSFYNLKSPSLSIVVKNRRMTLVFKMVKMVAYFFLHYYTLCKVSQPWPYTARFLPVPHSSNC